MEVIRILSDIENQMIAYLNWPRWTIKTFEILLSIIIVIATLDYIFTKLYGGEVNKKEHDNYTIEFRAFQIKYLCVYLLIMLADWLQGTNMYTLYMSYGMSVGTLFLTGFLSSAVFGTFLGIYVDRWGRKLGCIVFCILEIIINLLEHVPSMPVLLVGRILGGLSTSLLFSAFESWMVSEHRHLGFSEHMLTSTFAISSAGNGLMAIIAGLSAQVSADILGDIGPFQLAILLTVVSLVLIIPWNENYGSRDGSHQPTESTKASITRCLDVIYTDPSILCLGLSQACFEGAVYSFVFMWVPSLLAANVSTGVSESLPTGLIFSCFMLSMTIGGMLFALLEPIFPGGVEVLCIFIYIISACTMIIPVYSFDFWTIFIAFLVLEAMVGMFNSCGGTLRSRYYPQNIQSSVISIFRLPLNCLVVLGTKLTDKADNIPGLQFVFAVLAGIHIVSAILQIILKFISIHKSNQQIEEKEKTE